jgi:oxepin-CoA hydrolase/3-oxo-5,6-dehydrosuberyl-CoA semialdehyde dehydrogenase
MEETKIHDPEPFILNIMDREDIFNRLHRLKPDTAAVFGKMSAQHMVEHLLLLVSISSEKRPEKLYFREEKAEKFKSFTIYSDREMMVGFRAPMIPETPGPLSFDSLSAAIDQLRTELDDFDLFFRDHPSAKPVNPVMGPLDHGEWIIFHNKHFTHHFKQFNLLNRAGSSS